MVDRETELPPSTEIKPDKPILNTPRLLTGEEIHKAVKKWEKIAQRRYMEIYE